MSAINKKDGESMKQLNYNPLLDTDSYKLSHWDQYPDGMTGMMSYFESRGGEFDDCTLLGTQYLIDNYLSQPFTEDDINEANNFAAFHGEPFNFMGFYDMFRKYGGYFPVRIRAVPEGTVIPTGNVLMTVESTDPEFAWVVNYLETSLSRLWYPSTVGMLSREIKKSIKAALDRTSDTPEADLPFKLHSFGFRGVSSLESAGLGDFAHLCSFLGSDTIEGVRVANFHYDCPMAGFSIPATEHSTITSHGQAHEYEAFKRYVQKYLVDRKVPAVACVSDSYNIYDACVYWCSADMRKMLKNSGGTLIIRPDSGWPLDVLPKMFGILERALGSEVTVNQKGYKVLPPYLRVIQGDGVDRKMVRDILCVLEQLGWSATNIAFGSGGALLQKLNRDTQKFAFKCCSVTVNGQQRDVFKDPITDHGKKSKRGRLDLIRSTSGEYLTIGIGAYPTAPSSLLETVYENGPTAYRTNLEEIRQRMALK